MHSCKLSKLKDEKLSLLLCLLLAWFVIGVLETESEDDGVWLESAESSLFWLSFVWFVSSDDDDGEEVGTKKDEGGDDDIGLSLKWSSPNISVKEGCCSKDFTCLIWFHERDSSSVGFSGNGLSNMC